VGRSRRLRRERSGQVEACQSAPKAQGVRESRFCKCLSRLEFFWVTVSICRKNTITPSCHTAVVGGYVVEGHVPANDVKKLLAMKPVAVGLAVPGMPVGSPGMEMGSRKDPYQVLLVAKDGRERAFSNYN
jgi:hypothetical protein